MYNCYHYYDVHGAHETSHVVTGRPGPWPMICSVPRLLLRLSWVFLGRYQPKVASFVRRTLANRLACTIFILLRAHVGSKPWHRCGCTDDTPCRLGDASRMTFWPWFVPQTEPPVELREEGPDRGHRRTKSCSDDSCMCRCRTGDEDCCWCSLGIRR